jgi:hypothetical protein
MTVTVLCCRLRLDITNERSEMTGYRADVRTFSMRSGFGPSALLPE